MIEKASSDEESPDWLPTGEIDRNKIDSRRCPSGTTFALGRRAFLCQTLGASTAVVLGADTISAASEILDGTATLQFGMVTDLHYADKPTSGTRHYRETLAKLETAAGEFDRQELDFVVELGDFIDAADSVPVELGYLKTIEKKFSEIHDDRFYVLGNHCVDTLKKEEFLGEVGQQKSYFSFDKGGYHFVVLDSCFRSDGVPYSRRNFKWTDANIPKSELAWLKEDLEKNTRKTVVFAHQRLDVSNHYGVKNNAEVRKILEASGNVMAVFQGHSHKNDLKELNGIHYCTHVAMVEGKGKENNAFSKVNLHPDGSLVVDGFFKQSDYRWPGNA